MFRVAAASFLIAGLCSCAGASKSCGSDVYGSDQPTADEYVGLSESAAAARAATMNVPFRVTCRDGHAQPGTADLRPTRVNVGVDDGKVTSAHRY